MSARGAAVGPRVLVCVRVRVGCEVRCVEVSAEFKMGGQLVSRPAYGRSTRVGSWGVGGSPGVDFGKK